MRAENLANLRVHIPPGQTGALWKDLSQAAKDAGEALGLHATLRQMLGVLVSCYQGNSIDGRLMVWPGNNWLVRRTGLCERTVRSALRRLIGHGLVAAIDSSNRKRWARKAPDGTVTDAAGFSLTPLYERRYDLAMKVTLTRREAEEQGYRFDRITVARKAIEGALDWLGEQHGDFARILSRLDAIMMEAPRRGSKKPIEHIAAALEALREESETLILSMAQPTEIAGTGGTICRHKESTKDTSIDHCTTSDERQAIGAELVRQACPTVAEDFGLPMRTTREIEVAGTGLRASLGAGPDAWREAVDKLGLTLASILVLYVLQLHEDDVRSGQHRIKNPGGLYRSLVRQVAAGEVDLVASLQRLRRRKAN